MARFDFTRFILKIGLSIYYMESIINVKMKRCCFFCNAPTSICVMFPDTKTFNTFLIWKILFKRDFSLNNMFYKKIGSVVRPVCTYCYFNPPKFDLKTRETTGKVFRVNSKSLSVKDIWNWFDMFNDFRKRNDLKDILIVY